MGDKIYKITLTDGTVINDLKLNGNNFISSTEIEESVLDYRRGIQRNHR